MFKLNVNYINLYVHNFFLKIILQNLKDILNYLIMKNENLDIFKI